MWLGQVPLLTKGPFALLYGGQQIVPQLSKVRADKNFMYFLTHLNPLRLRLFFCLLANLAPIFSNVLQNFFHDFFKFS